MDPLELSNTLKRIATEIHTAKSPSKKEVIAAIESLILEIEPVNDLVGEVISILSSWLNLKYKTEICYRNFADRVKGPSRDALYEHWYEHAEEERQHAYNLSMKIVSLGGDPIQCNIEIPGCSSDAISFAEVIRDLENESVRLGEQLKGSACGDPKLIVMADEIILEDSRHIDDLNRMFFT